MMKATGIVRRIDDLGRVVIPKEIRRTMRIREGDPLEIYTDRDGEVIFKKYSPIGELGNFAMQYAEAMSRACSFPVLISDRDAIVAVYGMAKKDFLDKSVSEGIADIMEQRKIFLSSGSKELAAIDGVEGAIVQVAAPILAEGDVIGAVMIVNNDGVPATEVEEKLAQTAAGFLGRQLEP